MSAYASRKPIDPDLKARILKRYKENPDVLWKDFASAYKHMGYGDDYLKGMIKEAGLPSPQERILKRGRTGLIERSVNRKMKVPA